MNCPDRPHDLDLLLAGEPTSPDVQAHAESCSACASEVALARQIDASFASRRSVTAPPELIAAALAEAKGSASPARAFAAMPAADRLAQASGAKGTGRWGRLRVGAIALALALIAAFSWTTLRSPEASQEPVVAENEAPAPAPLAPEDTTAREDTTPPEALPAPEAAPPVVQNATPAPAPRRRAAPRRAPRQRPVAPAPAPEVAPDTAPAPENIAEADPTPTEIDRAQAELQLAFSLIAGAQRQAGRAVRNETGALSSTLEQTLPF